MFDLRPLNERPLNDNYDPPRTWACITRAEHECTNTVIGFLGAIPVCATGETAERAAREADHRRIAAWAESPEGRRTIAAEAAVERALEGRYS